VPQASASNGSTETCRRCPERRNSLRIRRIGCARARSSLRYAAKISSGCSGSVRASAGSSSRVASSAHCRSSRKIAVGCCAAIVASARRIASKSAAGSPLGAAGPSSGNSSARWSTSGPSIRGPPAVERRCARSTSTSGSKAEAPPGVAKPSSTERSDPASARRARVVLPTPASPASKISEPRPSSASAIGKASCAHSPSRPMNSSSAIECQPAACARSTAATERSTSSELVDQFDTEIRTAARPFHLVPLIQHVPSCCRRSSTR
jgi:hypothetical protein